VGKGKQMVYVNFFFIVVILFIEIAFQIDRLSDYINWGWFGSIKFMSKGELESRKKIKRVPKKEKEVTYFLFLFK